jgi:hypothetical protein
MAKAPAKKKAAAKAAPSSSAKTLNRRNGTVTLGKNATLGKKAS